MSKSFVPSRLSSSRRTAGFVAALLVGVVATAGCDGCGDAEKPKPEPEPKTKDTEPSEPSEDPIAGAAEEAEKSAVSSAVRISDNARLLAGNMEATNQPDEPARPQPDPPEEATGSIPTDKLNEVFRQHSAETRDCYERQLKTNPALAGRVVLTLKIGPRGSVARANAVGDTLRNEEVIDCLEAKARAWSFPEPDGGAAKVRKPFNFSPKQ